MKDPNKFHGYQASYTGFYKGHFLRSYPEFIYALYLDKVKKVKFETEPFCLHSLNSKKRKIPDFGFLGPDAYGNEILWLTEIKANHDQVIQTACDYATYRFIPDHNQIQVNFISIDNNSRRYWINKIVNVIGREEFNKLSTGFRDQRSNVNRVYTGFPGQKNPNFGKHPSQETLNRTKETKIKNNTWDTSGSKNPNFGNHLSSDAKLRIAAKWSDPIKKKSMKIKGMLTHIGRFTVEQKLEFDRYSIGIINNTAVKKPKFLNRAYCLTIEKILDLFGSISDFKIKVGISNE